MLAEQTSDVALIVIALSGFAGAVTSAWFAYAAKRNTRNGRGSVVNIAQQLLDRLESIDEWIDDHDRHPMAFWRRRRRRRRRRN